MIEFIGGRNYFYDFNQVVEKAAKQSGPTLYLSETGIEQKIRMFKDSLPNVQPHYAVKANPDLKVLTILAREGCNFEVASSEEFSVLAALDVSPDRILYSNPIKPAWMMRQLDMNRIRCFVADNLNEIKRIDALNRNINIYLRIHLGDDNSGSVIPLSGKFGASPVNVTEIIKYCGSNGINLRGLGFHVGSQCIDPICWRQGIQHAKYYFAAMRAEGLAPDFLNIGGGFPVYYKTPLGNIFRNISNMINKEIGDLVDTYHIVAEPGRFLVGDCGVFVTQVINTTFRNGMNWAYLDAGLFNGLFEAREGIEYEIRSSATGDRCMWTLAGPTCDSFDIITKKANLPANLKEGDFLYFMNAGAYTTAYATNFNGFDLPQVEFL
jgi:ornithine decarboxylase